MKKYTQPTVEITAFDFEDIICDSSSLNSANYGDTGAAFKTAVQNSNSNIVVVEW